LDFQLTVRSKEWLDQIALLEQVSNFLPPGFDLWIKEHPAAIGAYSIRELDKLLNSPNVKIICDNIKNFFEKNNIMQYEK
jgi:hypothetical protein